MFVDAQEKFMGETDKERRVAEQHVKDYSTVAPVSRALLGTLIGKDLADKAFAGKLTPEDKTQAVRVMRDEEGWAKAAYEYARIIGPYVKDQLKDMEQNIDLQTLLKKMAEDEKFRREVLKAGIREKAGNSGGMKGTDDSDDAQQQHGQGDGKKRKNSQFLYVREYEAFDQIYQATAGQIVVDFTKEGGEDVPRLPLFNMRRKMVEGEPAMQNIDWSRTIFGGKNGQRPIFTARDLPFEVDMDGPSGVGSYKNILFVVDVSGSMGWSGAPLDGSRYDMCIRTIYSVVNYLEKAGKASYLDYALMQFSNKTIFSGWQSHQSLPQMKKQLFTGYQAGYTGLDPATMRKAMATSSDKFLVMMVSDGDLNVDAEAGLAVCKEAIRQGNDFVLFQIQSNSSFANEIQKEGGIVIDINDPRDLLYMSLRVIKDKYTPQKKVLKKAPAGNGDEEGNGDRETTMLRVAQTSQPSRLRNR
jgi:hypothetical protein